MSGPRAFEAVFGHGSRFEGRYVQLIAMPAAEAIGRFGVVAGRKVLRRAVDRNRLRRVVREMLKSARPQAIAFDLVLRLKRPVQAADIPQIVAEAARLLQAADAARRATPEASNPR